MATVRRCINEIEAYLLTPMIDAESNWEQEERISLYDLLVLLKAEMDRAGAGIASRMA